MFDSFFIKMKRLHTLKVAKPYRLLLSVLLAFGANLIPLSHAFATSDVDNVVVQASTLTIVNPTFYPCASTSAGSRDLSTTWATEFRKMLSGSSLESFDQRKAWTVTLSLPDVGWGVYPMSAHISWWESGALPVTATFNASALNGPTAKRGYISMDWETCDLIGGVLPDSAAPMAYNNPTGNISFHPFLTYNLDVAYPLGYEGVYLSQINEAADSDGDGLSDYVESPHYPNRQRIFCNTSNDTCAYPDPIKQDIYVEVDWMHNITSSKTFKPTSAQLELVSDMYDNEDINVHFDTGDYGGGNQLTNYASALRQDSVASIPDFADYKNGGDGISHNFSSERLGIWRYMIYGEFYSLPSGTSGSSGWSEVMGDDLFISGGIVENVTGAADNDRAVANTIAHELGHSLCLSSARAYFEQDEQCVFAGVDNRSGQPPINDPDLYYNLESYESVMNYRYQLTDQDDIGEVNYSSGPNSSTNHDDWLAVKSHLGKFNGTHTLYVEFGAKAVMSTVDKPLSVDGLVIAESTR